MNPDIKHHVESVDHFCEWDLTMQTVTLAVTVRNAVGEPMRVAFCEHSIDVLASLLDEVRKALIDSMPKDRQAFGGLSLGDSAPMPKGDKLGFS